MWNQYFQVGSKPLFFSAGMFLVIHKMNSVCFKEQYIMHDYISLKLMYHYSTVGHDELTKILKSQTKLDFWEVFKSDQQ